MSERPRVVLLDVEGTTTPVDFVHRVLFPYARTHLGQYLATHSGDPELARELHALEAEHARDVAAGRKPPPWADAPEGAAAYGRWLIDQDRKATPLKSLQGRIWEAGYRAGVLRGQVYDDVPRAFERWRAAGRAIAIFSSGSVLAQKLLFAHTCQGDLTPFLSAHFDTTTGRKDDAESYRRIATALGCPAGAMLFVSDALAELEAARSGGLQTVLCIRPPASPAGSSHRTIGSFDALP